MKFNQIDIQKLDESGYYSLDNQYLLSYNYSDGFTERLLNVDIFVDLNYTCKIDLRFYLPQKNISEIQHLQFESEIPTPIKATLQLLINEPSLVLKKYYADTFMEDAKREYFVVNHDGKSHSSGIGILVNKIKFVNESERLLFLLQKQFSKWKEELYITTSHNRR